MLLWQLTWGKDEEFLEEIAEEDGELPRALEEKPELEPHQEGILEAFYLLSCDRPIGMGGVGAIPTTGILALAGVIKEDPWDFLVLCRALDAVYLERINAKTSQEKPEK